MLLCADYCDLIVQTVAQRQKVFRGGLATIFPAAMPPCTAESGLFWRQDAADALRLWFLSFLC